MATIEEMLTWAGRPVVDPAGETIGEVDELVVDDETDEPVFALVRTASSDTHTTFVPLDGAEERDGAVAVPFDRTRVTAAPTAGRDAPLEPDLEARLYEHYGMAYVDTRLRRHGR